MPKFQAPPPSWSRKFGNAFRGIWLGIRGQTSFVIHGVVACAVIALGIYFQVQPWEWSALVGCIAVVFAAELFNSAVEWLAKAITEEHNEHIGKSLDIASGAVLVTALGSVIIGCIILGPYVLAALG